MAPASRVLARALVLACAALVTAGCDTRALTANTTGGGGGGGTGISLPDAGVDGTYTATRDVDILFMIDNSSGMRLAQANLERNFPTFVATLRSLPGGPPNLHIAVITSDLGAGDGSIAGCAGEGDGGRFQYTARGTCTATGLAPGATFLVTEGDTANFTGNLEDVFTCIAAVGGNGCGFEQPLAAVARALGADGRAAPMENQGFLRPNALLFIVLLTDEDDCSVSPGVPLFDTTANTTLASQLGPVTNFRCNEFGHLCAGVRPPRFAPTGSTSDTVSLANCVSADADAILWPVATLRDQLRALKPFPDQQILVAAIAGPSTPYTIQWKTASINDTGPWPVIGHSCTAPDGSFADPAVRINEFAAAFGANGMSQEICLDSFAPVFSTLASHLAERIPDLP